MKKKSGQSNWLIPGRYKREKTLPGYPVTINGHDWIISPCLPSEPNFILPIAEYAEVCELAEEFAEIIQAKGELKVSELDVEKTLKLACSALKINYNLEPFESIGFGIVNQESLFPILTAVIGNPFLGYENTGDESCLQ